MNGIGQGRTLTGIEPVHVAAYIETLTNQKSAPTVKQHLAAMRMLFDWLITGGSSTSTRPPPYAAPSTSSKGKTPVLTADQARELLDSIPRKIGT